MKNKNIDQEILNSCKMLYKMHDHSCMETCMCWGFECGEGWLDTIYALSKKLEALNLTYYPKYNVRIQADQVKEKYGTLHYYYSIVIDPPFFIRWYENAMNKMLKIIFKHIDFKIKFVYEKEAYTSIEEEVFDTREKYEEEKKRYEKSSSYSFEEVDDRFIKKTKIYHAAKGHNEATKHKFLYWIYKKQYSIINFLRHLLNNKPSKKQLVIVELLDYFTNSFIKDAENKCYHTCENCGTYIGTKYSPRHITRGWIKYICKNCADKLGCETVIDSKV